MFDAVDASDAGRCTAAQLSTTRSETCRSSEPIDDTVSSSPPPLMTCWFDVVAWSAALGVSAAASRRSECWCVVCGPRLRAKQETQGRRRRAQAEPMVRLVGPCVPIGQPMRMGGSRAHLVIALVFVVVPHNRATAGAPEPLTCKIHERPPQGSLVWS